MGEPIIILLLLFGLTSASQTLPNGCPTDFSVHSLLRHETDCDKYYSCSNGQIILMTCPSNTLFDFDLQVCNHATAVVCETSQTKELADTTTESVAATTEFADTTTESIDTTTELANTTTEFVATTTEFADTTTAIEDSLPDGCTADSSTHLLLPHEDCDKFYSCSNGQKVSFTCPGGTLFDFELQICNWAYAVTCTGSYLETTTDSSLTTTKTNEKEEAVGTSIESIQVTTPSFTTASSSSKTEDTVELFPTDATTEASLPSVCPDGFFGSVPHPELCESYYVCTGWEPIQLFCLPGFEFDPQLQTCVEITEGGCTWNQQQYTTTESEITSDSSITDATDDLNTKTTAFQTSTTPGITTITTKEPSTPEATTVEKEDVTEESTTQFNPTTPSVCPDGFFGSVPHPDICESYYVCTGWDPIQLFCLPGWEFDIQLQTCVEITEGGCTWNQQQHTTTESEITSDSSITDATEDLNTKTPAFQTSTTPEITITTKEPSTPEATTDIEDVTEVLETTTDLNPTTPSVCPDGYFGSVPHPHICESYYVCTGWDPIQLFCLPGFEFDPHLQTCVEITEGGCTWSQTTTTQITDITRPDSSTTESTEIESSTTFETTTRDTSELSTVTSEQEATIKSTTELPTTEKTTEIDETTIYPTTNNLTTNDPTTEELTTEDWKTTESQSITPTICPDGYFGNLPHPERCDAYYLCSGWSPILLFCSNGFEFDPETGTCVQVNEGGCTWNQQQHTTTESEITSDSSITDTTDDINTKTTTFEPSTKPEITITTTESITTTKEPSTPEGTTKTELSTTESTETKPSTLLPTTIETTTKDASELSTTEVTAEQETTIKWTTELPTTEKTTDNLTTDNLTTNNPTTEEITTEDWKTTESQSITPTICPDGYFGNLPHPERCDAYYLCSGWSPILLFCSNGFEFDPVTGTCVIISEGGCTWHQTGTSKTTEEQTETISEEPSTVEYHTDSTTEALTKPDVTEETVASTVTIEMSTSNAITEGTTPKETTEGLITEGITQHTTETTAEWSITPEITTEKTIDSTTEEWISSEFTTKSSTTLVETTEHVTSSQVTDDLSTTDKTTTTVITEEDKTTEFANTESTTVQSTTGSWVITTDQEIFPTDDLTTQVFTTTESPDATEELTEAPSEFTTTTKPICPDGFFGNIPHTERCDAYYLCSGWNPILLYCSSGFEFDPELGDCVVIAEGGCTWPQISTSTTSSDLTSSQTIDPELITEMSTISEVTSTDETVNTTFEVTTEKLTTLELGTTDAFTTESISPETTEPISTEETEQHTTKLTTMELTTDGSTLTTGENTEVSELATDSTTTQRISTESEEFTTVNGEYSTTSSTITSENIDVVSTTHDVTTKLTTEESTSPNLTTVESSQTTKETTTQKSTSITDVTYTITDEPVTNSNTPTITTAITTTESGEVTSDKQTTDDLNGTTIIESSTTGNWGVITEQGTTSEATEGVTPTTCPDGYFGNIPHPERCDAYYLCSGWNPILLYCPSGHEFDPHTASCVGIAAEGCTYPTTTTEETTTKINDLTSIEQETTIAESNTVTFTTAYPTTQEHTTEAQLNITTDGDIITTEGYITTTEEDITTIQEITTTEKVPTPELEPTTLEPSTELLEVTEEIEATTPTPCPTGYFGNIPHPDRCDAYYLCSGWNPILLFCPSGHEFDTETAACVIITEGGCTWLQTTTTVTEPTIEASSSGLLTLSTTDAFTYTSETFTSVIDEELTSSEAASTEIFEISSTEAFTVDELLTPATFTSPEAARTESELATTAELEETTETLETTTPAICPDGFFGMIANAAQCDTYYLCSGWMPILLRCSSGYEFDPNTEACVFISEGGCTLGQNRIVTDVNMETKFEDKIMKNKLNIAEADTNSKPNINVIHLETDNNVRIETLEEAKVCQPGFYGNVTKMGSCNTFYMCVDGAAMEMQCLLSTEFDAATQKCVLISEHGCNANTIVR